MKIDGGCHCGEITYEAELDPTLVGICHCSDCQTLSASAFRTVAVVNSETFKILTGTPKDYIKIAASGKQRIQAFCGDCGAGLYATDVGDGPKKFNLRVGSIHQRGELKPHFELWRQSALEWVPEVDDIEPAEKFDQGRVVK